MDIAMRKEGDKTVFTLTGRLDTATSPGLQAALLPETEASKRVELDFGGVEYVSSAGLRVLLMAEKQAKKSGCELILVQVNPEVMEVLEMTGFANILHFG